MTPFEYSAFRNELGRSSGFQSVQYRLLEFLLRQQERRRCSPCTSAIRAAYALLQRALEAPSLYDEVLRLLSRRGYGSREDYLTRDFSAAVRRRASRWPAPGWASTTTPRRTGTCTSWPSGWWTSTTTSSCGVPSPEDGGAHHRLQARHRRHRRACPTSPRRWSSSSSRSCGRSARRCRRLSASGAQRDAQSARLPAHARSRDAVHQQRTGPPWRQVRQVLPARCRRRCTQRPGCWPRSCCRQRTFSAPRRLAVVSRPIQALAAATRRRCRCTRRTPARAPMCRHVQVGAGAHQHQRVARRAMRARCARAHRRTRRRGSSCATNCAVQASISARLRRPAWRGSART